MCQFGHKHIKPNKPYNYSLDNAIALLTRGIKGNYSHSPGFDNFKLCFSLYRNVLSLVPSLELINLFLILANQTGVINMLLWCNRKYSHGQSHKNLKNHSNTTSWPEYDVLTIG